MVISRLELGKYSSCNFISNILKVSNLIVFIAKSFHTAKLYLL